MRVLFVTGEYPPMQGGVGDYTWALGAALNALGVDVHVLTSHAAGPSHLAPQGVANVYPEIEKWGWSLPHLVRQLAGDIQADVLHIQYQSAAYGLHPVINLLPKLLGQTPWPRAKVVTFHDLRVPYLFPKAGPLRWQANITLASHSDWTIVTNAEDYRRLGRYSGLNGKLAEVPIGANIQPDPPAGFDRNEQRAAWGVGPDDLLLCYFGFLNVSKGGEELIQSTARLVAQGLPAHLLMVGGQVGASDPTNNAYLERVRAIIAQLGLSDRVHWTGFTAAAEVTANLLASDVAVLPYRDGASFRRGSLMAALAHGLPVVSIEPVVQNPNLAHGDNIWLAPAGSVAAIAGGVRQIWADPDLRRRLSQGARRLSGQFSWDSIAQRHLEIYRELS